MDQRVPLLCETHKSAIVGMCLDEQCKNEEKLFCFVCCRKEHSQCDGNKGLAEFEFIQELRQLQQDLGLMMQSRINTDSFQAIKNEIIQSLALIEQQIAADNIRLNQCQVIQQRIQVILQNSFTKEAWKEGYGLLLNKQKNNDNSYEQINQNLQKLQQSLEALSQTKNTPGMSSQCESQNIYCDWGDLTTGRSFEFKTPIRAISCSSDGRVIACGGDDGIIRRFDPKNGKLVGPDMIGHTAVINSICFSRDNKLLVSGSGDNSVRIWDTNTGKSICDSLGHTQNVICVSFSPDSQSFASGCQDASIKIWKLPNRNFKSLNGHTSQVWSIDYSPDGKLLISSGGDLFIRLWDTETGQEFAYNFKGHTAQIQCVRFSTNGKNIVSGSFDKTLRIWDLDTGKELKRFDVNTGVKSVAYSPNGETVMSGLDDFQVILWDIQSNNKKALKLHTNQIWSLQYSPDGRYIVSGSSDKTIQVQAIQ